jgi:hypothetical protein
MDRVGTAPGGRSALPAMLVDCDPPPALPQAEAAVTSPSALRVEWPREGETIRCRSGFAPVAGHVTVPEASPSDVGDLDLMIVIDLSGSTEYPSEADVDGDGKIGETQRALLAGMPDVTNTDPGDSILAAETLAATALLDRLPADRVRVGVVTFAGEIDPRTGRRHSKRQEDAWLEAPLTGERGLVRESLEDVRRRGCSGGTNMEAGIKLALRELAGFSGAQSQPRPDAKRVILFLTDGAPSLPFGLGNQTDPEDIEAVQGAARLAAAAGVTIKVYGLGPQAIDFPIACTEMARLTTGLYTPLKTPGDVVGSLGLPGIPVIRLHAVNLDGDVESQPGDFHVLEGGSFIGRVPALEGANRVWVTAFLGNQELDSVEVAFTMERPP